MNSTQALALGSLLVWTVLFARGLSGLRRTPRLTPRPDVDGEVSVYIPARDEAEVVERSILAVLRDSAVSVVVVVDDRSSDGTGKILADLDARTKRLTTLAAPEPGFGRCGKPAALVHAYRSVPPTAEWILFLDADVVLAEGAVGALVAEAERKKADLVSLVPSVTMGSFIEEVVMPSVGAIVLAHLPPHRVNDPKDSKAFANGQVILLRRSMYEAINGHETVVGEVLEDVAIARRVKAKGGRLLIVDGRDLAETRMYSSFGELWEGWTKNLFLLMDSRWWVTAGWAAVSVMLGSLGWLVLGFERGLVGGVVWIVILAMQAMLRSAGGAKAWGAVFAPIGALVAAVMLLSSAIKHLSGRGVRWKGRTY